MESRFQCNICLKNYPPEENFKDHKKNCKTTSNKFKCSYCNKFLSSKQNLKEHKFTHTGELPYVCRSPGCGLRFRQGSVLSAHKRIHLTIDRYINQEKYHWVKLTDLVIQADESDGIIIKENLDVVKLPLITKPQELKIGLAINKVSI